MKIGFIGAGKVGFSLGKFFAQGGVDLAGYYSRSQQSAEEAAAFTDSHSYVSLEGFVQDCDAIFITVPDGTISSVFAEICAFEIRDKFICHCSGALSAKDAFPGIEETGARGISIHPIFPVSDKYTVYQGLADAFFCLEGDDQAVEVFTGLLQSLGAHAQKIDSATKVRYHAGCVMASNFICGLAQESIDLLTGCGFTPESAVQALAPLMRSNLEHLIEAGPVTALTGPVERCDTGTVSKHLACLADQDQRDLYRLLTKELVGMAQSKHPDQDYSEMKKIIQ